MEKVNADLFTNRTLPEGAQGRLTYPQIIDKYGLDTTPPSLSHHANQHLPVVLARADIKEGGLTADKAPVFRSENVYEDVLKLRDSIMGAIERAEKSGNDRDLREAIKSAIPLMNLAARMAGLIEERLRVSMDISQSEDFQFLMGIILNALNGYPDAREAVLKALEVADPMRGATFAIPAGGDFIEVDWMKEEEAGEDE